MTAVLDEAPPRLEVPPHRAPSRWPWAVGAVAGLDLLILAAPAGPLPRVLLLAVLIGLPGWLLLRWCGFRAGNVATQAVVTVAASLSILLLVGLAVDLVAPLRTVPLAVGLSLAVGVLALGAARVRDPIPLPDWRSAGVALGGLALPVLAVAGARALDNGAPPALAIVAALAAGAVLVGTVVLARRLGDGVVVFLLCCAAAALVLSFSTRGNYLVGYDVQQEFSAFSHVHAAARWVPTSTGSADDAYRAMLSITVLPQLLVALCHVAPLTVFRVVLPLTLVLVPATVFGLCRGYASRRVAAAVAVLPVLLPQFVSELPAVTRQAVALGIFGGLLILVYEAGARSRTRTALACLLGTGVVLSHYTTSYLAVLILGAGWLATTLVRLLRKGEGPCAVPWVAVVWLVGACVVWNVVVTDSVTNVRQAASSTTTVASAPTGSAAQRWLNATVPSSLTPTQYEQLVTEEYKAQYPWMQQYPAVQTDPYPLRAASAGDPGRRGVPLLGKAYALANPAVSQLTIVAVVAGVAMSLWLVRRRRDRELELPLAAAVTLAVTAVGRVSGTAIASYNADRLYLQSMLLFGVPLALLASVGSRPRLKLAVFGGVVLVMFLNCTGLSAYVTGRAPSTNLANTGEAAERYLYSDTDVVTARWLASTTPHGALIFTDRYGELPAWQGAGIDRSLFTTLAPTAVDTRGYVFLTHVNVRDGRARGAVGTTVDTMSTPTDFYDATKDLIYSTGATRVYR